MNGIERIVRYRDLHIEEKLSLIDVAEVAGYSVCYFSREFSETMGLTLTTYVRVRKFQHALMDLDKGISVVDTAMKYGFESHEGFTRSFKKLFGFAPETVKDRHVSYTLPDIIIPSIRRSNVLEIRDDGRGIPLSGGGDGKDRLNSIFVSVPGASLSYRSIEDFEGLELNTICSLSERFEVTVYRNGKKYTQDYVRGIPMHELSVEPSKDSRGMQVRMKLDVKIFGEQKWDMDRIKKYASAAMVQTGTSK